MALNGPRLEGEIYTPVRAALAALTSGQSVRPGDATRITSALDQLADAISKSGSPIVSEIDTNAVVTVHNVTSGGSNATGTVA